MRPRHGPSPDRKSTRLNSSHRTSSYAVFCLKKKKGEAGTDLFVVDADGASFVERHGDSPPSASRRYSTSRRRLVLSRVWWRAKDTPAPFSPPGATIAPPAAEVKRAGRARSESEWLSAPADVLQLVMRESMILVLAGGRLAPHVTALSEQPKRGALHHHHERAPHERGSR